MKLHTEKSRVCHLIRSLETIHFFVFPYQQNDVPMKNVRRFFAEEPSGDEELLNWLHNLNVPEPDIAKVFFDFFDSTVI